MANSLTGRQWFLDTPGATVLWQGNAKIKNVIFSNYTGAADVAVLTDVSGRVVCSLSGNADFAPIVANDVGWVDGLIMPTLTTGNVIVTVE